MDPEENWLWLVGTFGKDKYEVYCDFAFFVVKGKRVCFYYPTSQYISWPLIEEFLEPYFLRIDGIRNKCDANNFHRCLDYLQRNTTEK